MDQILKTSSRGYSVDYIEGAFWEWYGAEQPSAKQLMLSLKNDSNGNKPSLTTIQLWMKEFNWRDRAAEYNKKAREQVEAEFLNQKTQMLIRHAEEGRTLQVKGMEFLENNEIKSAHAALRAVELGIQIERDATNLEKLIETVTKMDDPKIQSKLESLLNKASLRPDDKNE